MKKNILFFIFLFVFVVLRFFLIDHGATKALYDFDEARYAQVARNIIKTNNWTYLIGGYPDNVAVKNVGMVDFWKPPLHPILIALSYKLFGSNELAVRLPSLLFFLGNCVLVLFFAKLLAEKNKVLPYLAVVLFALLPDNAFLYSQGIAEQQLLFFNLLAIVLITQSQKGKMRDWIPACAGMTPLRQGYEGHSKRGVGMIERSMRMGMYVLAGISWGLAILTKGAAAWWVPLIIPVLIINTNNEKNDRSNSTIFTLIQLFIAGALVVSLPWHLYMYLKFGRLFIDHYLLVNTIGRSLGTTSNIAPIWWYGAWMIWNWRPIIFLLPLIMGQIINTNNWANNQNNNLRKILLWFLLIIIPFSLVKSKVWWYIYPAAIPLILLSAEEVVSNPLMVLFSVVVSMLTIWDMGAMYIKIQLISFVLYCGMAYFINIKIKGQKRFQTYAIIGVILVSLFFSIQRSMTYTDINKDLKQLFMRNEVNDLSVYKMPYEAALSYANLGEIKRDDLHSSFVITKKENASALQNVYKVIDEQGEFVLMKH